MRLLICLSNAEVTLVLTERLHVLRRVSLPVNYDDAALAEALTGVPAGVKVDLLTDLLDEDRHTESIARVMPWEQDALLKRMLRRHKGSEALFYSRWVGTEKNAEGRVEKQAHVVSLSDTQELDRLLEALKRYGLSISGVYSLSELVSQACKPKQKGKKSKGQADILLIKTSPDSYRQMLVVDGITRLSRQVQLQSEYSDELHEEQSGFERFIMVQRLVPFGQQFSYTLIGWDQAQLQRFSRACTLNDQTVVTERQIRTDRLKRAELLEDYPALALVLEVFSRRFPATHFQPLLFLAARKQRRVRVTMWRMAQALMVAALLQSVSVAVDTWNHQQVLMQMAQLERNYMGQARHYEAQANLPARADDIRDATLFVEGVLAHRDLPGLRQGLVNISQVFEQFSAFELRAVGWERPTLEQLAVQELTIEGQFELTDQQSLKWLIAYLDAMMLALEVLPAVQKVERGQLPVEADDGDTLSVDLDLEQNEPREYPIEITIELNYDSESA